ncbi:hypothetical protein COL922a_008762 [Colletotrichum nupharicola]|nr:hypothetical protein COL922a_008762 [Colletotrichum nupharicola]
MDPMPDDAFIPGDRDFLYSPRCSLVLTPHEAPKPWGHHYPDPFDLKPADMGPTDEEKNFSQTQLVFSENNRPLRFDQEKQKVKDEQRNVVIVKMIPGNRGRGDFPGPHNLLCRVTRAPAKQKHLSVGDSVFIKVYDPLFWWATDLLDIYFKVKATADMAFCDEVGAYSFLQEKGLTGFPHLAPEFFGSWTAAVTSSNPKYEGQTRHVGVLALEYIDGMQLDKLFTPGTRPRSQTATMYWETDTPVSFDTNEETCMGVMKKLIWENMEQEFAGITHGDIHPRSVLVSMRNGNDILDSPRVSLLGWRRSVIDEISKHPQNAFAYYSRPIQPFNRFNIIRLRDFLGWIPRDWKGREDNPRDSWQLHKWFFETFGTIVNENNPNFQAWPEWALLDHAFMGLTVSEDAYGDKEAIPSIWQT